MKLNLLQAAAVRYQSLRNPWDVVSRLCVDKTVHFLSHLLAPSWHVGRAAMVALVRATQMTSTLRLSYPHSKVFVLPHLNVKINYIKFIGH